MTQRVSLIKLLTCSNLHLQKLIIRDIWLQKQRPLSVHLIHAGSSIIRPLRIVPFVKTVVRLVY